MTLRMERDTYPIETMGGWTTDPGWVFTDTAGHEHRMVEEEYPTLRWIEDKPYWCPDCRDEHVEGWYECRECGQPITPGTKYEGPKTELLIGSIRYYLDDQPISKEEAEAFLARLT